jgi:hypothetical protein
MDYAEAFMAIAESLSDLRRRVITLEASRNNENGNDSLVERIDEIEERLHSVELNYINESDADTLIENAISNIDWQDKVEDVIRSISFTVTID